LLRRTQKIVFRDEEPAEAPVAAEPAPPPPSERRTATADRRSQDPDRNVVPIVERRQAERRQGIEALRAEALKSVISQVEDRNFGGLRNNIGLRPGKNLRRFALLGVAIVAGALAAFLALQREAPPPLAPAVIEAAPEVVMEPRVPVLVAREAVGAGERLSAEMIGWEDWPAGAVREDYVTAETSPEAATEFTGAIVRFAIFAGEPIRAEKLAVAGQGGYLAAVLEPGMRAVSVVVMASTASGGFIAPSDRVDVVLTRTIDNRQSSETLLSGVRVLAINDQMGEAPKKKDEDSRLTFGGEAIATLELTPPQAEMIAGATTLGRLSLSLRSMVEPAEDFSPAQTANQFIRMTSPFWNP
jgi:pilus assembly protein CpaB